MNPYQVAILVLPLNYLNKSCALPLGDWPINQDAASSIDLPTDLSFQPEKVRVELTTYSLTINLLQASFFILHIYYNKNFNNFQKRELGTNHLLYHPTKRYFVNTQFSHLGVSQ